MTPAEIKFKLAVFYLVRKGIHPTPTPILLKLGRTGHNLNGRECRWLREDIGIANIYRLTYADGGTRRVRVHDCDLNCCRQNGKLAF